MFFAPRMPLLSVSLLTTIMPVVIFFHRRRQPSSALSPPPLKISQEKRENFVVPGVGLSKKKIPRIGGGAFQKYVTSLSVAPAPPQPPGKRGFTKQNPLFRGRDKADDVCYPPPPSPPKLKQARANAMENLKEEQAGKQRVLKRRRLGKFLTESAVGPRPA